MAFPIIPKKRSGASGYPTTLEVGELAVNTLNGELYLGGDSAVMLLNGPVAAGTTVTEHTGDGTTVAFTFAGYNGTEDGGYIVSVGGIDQPPSKYSITNTAGGTITFVEAPVSGELISIRALVAGSGGGGSGDATSLQGRDIATTAPTDGQVLAWNATTSKWEPTSINGSVSFNAPGTHSWAVPAWVRWVYVSAIAGDGSDGTATNGADGEVGANATETENATTGSNGADGTASAGAAGKSISINALSLTYNGGAAGQIGLPGFGGGGSGGGGYSFYGPHPANGSSGNGVGAGGGGLTGVGGTGFGGAAGGEGATAGGDSSSSIGGNGGIGAFGGGDGGAGGNCANNLANGGGGGGGGVNRAGGGGGAGGVGINGEAGGAGVPGKGGIADTSMCAGGAGESFSGPKDLTAVAGTTISIVISEGAGDASITITY